MERISPQDRERVREAMTESVRSSRPLDLEYRVVHRDQKAHVVWVHANPTQGSDGKAVGLRGIGQDVTDQASPTGDVNNRDRGRAEARPASERVRQGSVILGELRLGVQAYPDVGEDAEHQHGR